MIWTDEKDTILGRELLLADPFQFKEKTRERGQGWQAIADKLNNITETSFSVSARAVRERFTLLQSRWKKKERMELNGSGISPEVTELDILLEEIILKIKEHERTFDKKNEKQEQEKEAAQDMRQAAMETFQETKKRKNADDGESKKKSRASGSETVQFLREKMKDEYEMRQKELELKRLDQEKQAEQQKQALEQNNNMMQLLQQSMQQGQQQMQLTFMQNQQAQSQAFLSIIEKLSK